jgi:hypothetical protein
MERHLGSVQHARVLLEHQNKGTISQVRTENIPISQVSSPYQ